MILTKDPKNPIITGSCTILIYFIIQFSQPFISTFEKTEGILQNYVMVENEKMTKNKILKIWVSGFKEPFFNEYPGSYSDLLKNIDEIKNQKVTVWYSDNQEIRQLQYNDSLFIEYDWFNLWLLIMLGAGISFIWVAYDEMKEKCTNINTIWDMFDYVFGGRKLIIKHNNKPYRP